LSDALLANALPNAILGSRIILEFEDESTRPFARIDAYAKPLSFDALLDLYSELDHDLRPMLSSKDRLGK
jgi:hypothetical protein